jgi:hypothetical protein
LPLITGRFVGSAEISESVLWDFRKLIGNLMTENYYQYFTELCHQDGLRTYVEPYGFGPLNDLDVGGKADIPMGEFWMNRPITQVQSAVSAAHIYGKPVISAESFTSTPEINWKGHPAMAKASGDLAWTMGINEFMFHRFAHQANTYAEPGMTMNRWGFHFDRTQTWWYNAGTAWFNYIARGSYLLRQGHPVSDLLIFVGDGAPNSSFQRKDFDSPIPLNINFDAVNADVLLNRAIVKDRKITLPEGTTYPLLILRNTKRMTLPTLKRVRDFVNEGVPIYGDIPQSMAGYGHSKKVLDEFNALLTSVRGKIKPIDSWRELMERNNIQQDFSVVGRSDIPFSHRKTEKEEVYFFFNPDSVARTFVTNFRASGKIPEQWNPMDGTTKKMASFVSNSSVTTCSIHLKARESIFVVFRENATSIVTTIPGEEDARVQYKLSSDNTLQALVQKSGTYSTRLSTGDTWNFSITDLPEPMVLEGNWQVNFHHRNGTESSIQMPSLMDWKDHADESIKYFSGTATYKKEVIIQEQAINSNTTVMLTLGQVHIVAEVIVNNQKIGTLWTAPFEMDITKFVRSGKNKLEIKVTNLWSNKLIGDECFPANDGGYKLGPHGPTNLKMPDWFTNNKPRPAGERTTFTTAPFYTKDDPLMPSGLIGPVKLLFYKTKTR